MKRLHGVVPAILTPFREDGAIDEEALRAHCGFMVSSGVHGVFAVGSTGEFALMDESERMRVAAIAVEEVAGRLPIYVHTGAVSTESAVRLSLHARSIGADGVAVVAPYYFGVGQEELAVHFRTVAESVGEDFPMYLYNIPGAAGNEIEVETARRLAGIPNVVGIKNSTADFVVNLELLRAAPAGFDVVMGQETMFFHGLIAGVRGCISGIANAFPEAFVDLYEAYRRGDLAAAKERQEAVVRLARVLYVGGKNLAYYKAALGWRGFVRSRTRRPLYSADADAVRKLDAELTALDSELGLTRRRG